MAADVERRSCLLECPVEVQTLILDNLDENADKRAMTLVNKQLGGIAQAILYKDIEMKWTHRDPHPLGLIVRTLFDRPDLANVVKSLQLDGCIASRAWTKTSMPLELSAISGFMGDTKDTDYWANEVARGTLSAVAAFLVALTPKVEQVLASAPHLKRLTWLYTAPPRYSANRQFCIDALGASLQPIRFTLNELTLRIHPGAETGYAAGILELQDFAVLRSLTLPFGLLQGVSPRTRGSVETRLPASLVSLVLTGDLEGIVDHEWTAEEATDVLSRFLDRQYHAPGRLRKLVLDSKLVCEVYDLEWPYVTKEFEQLQKHATRCGVDLQIWYSTSFDGSEGTDLLLR
ncbi:hypothetical protein ACLX1H_001191 [Fusarium chlamydosporum]